MVFILYARAFRKEEAVQTPQSRQAAVRRVLVIYAAISWGCLVAAAFIGNMVFIVLTGIIAVLASVGLVVRWSLKS